jgi:hypothetical protein
MNQIAWNLDDLGRQIDFCTMVGEDAQRLLGREAYANLFQDLERGVSKLVEPFRALELDSEGRTDRLDGGPFNGQGDVLLCC